ncbi:MAG TPA: hypothetical protein ENN43_06810, partial [bacterium]|nr:hypothetical protein [bacterium]
MKKMLIILLFVFSCFGVIFGAAEVRNVAVTGGCYTPGQNITVNFEVRCAAYNTTFGSIIFSADNSPHYTDDAVWTSEGPQDPPDNNGHDGGSMQAQGSNGSAWHQKSYVVKVPLWYNGTHYVIVNVAENYMQLHPWGQHIQNSASVVMAQCAVPTATHTPVPPTATNTQIPPTYTYTPILPTFTFTITETSTPTITLTPIIGEGSAIIFPEQITAGSTGNTILITYTAGETNWEPVLWGTLKLTIPEGWSPPSLTVTDPGCVNVIITNGSLLGTSINGREIIIQARDLQPITGQIKIEYGDKKFGSPGATAQGNTGTARFIIKVTPKGDAAYEIANSPIIEVVGESTFTETNTTESISTQTNFVFQQNQLNNNCDKIIFSSDRDGNWEVYEMSADGSNIVNLTNFPGALDYAWDYSSNRDKILFTSDRDGITKLYEMNGDGTNVNEIADNLLFYTDPKYSSDGTKIVFISQITGALEIFLMNSNGTEITQITNDGIWKTSPALSPDGTTIIYGASVVGGSDIFEINADGSGSPRNLTNTEGNNDECPVFSSDGQKILFVSWGPGGLKIYEMDRDGSNVTILTPELVNTSTPNYSSDNTRIIFSMFTINNKVHRIFIMNRDGSEIQQLTNTAAGYHDFGPIWKKCVITPSPTPDPTIVAVKDSAIDWLHTMQMLSPLGYPAQVHGAWGRNDNQWG